MHATTYVYDALGRKIQETLPDADGNLGTNDAPVTKYEYDASGNVVKVTDAMGQVTRYEYDGLGRKVKETGADPDGAGGLASAVTTWEYDANGNLINVVDPLGNQSGGDPAKHATVYEYDAMNRKLKETQPDADGNPATANDTPITRWVYNGYGELASFIDPAGNATTYTYDALGRLKSETNQLRYARTYGYDGNGNRTLMTNRNGQTRQLVYDGLDRLTAEKWLSGVYVVRTITSTYDVEGRLVEQFDPESWLSYGYDGAGRLMSQRSHAGGAPDLWQSYEYDLQGRRRFVRITVDGVADLVNEYVYDNLDRVTRVVQSGAGVNAKRVDVVYNNLDQQTQLTRYASLDQSWRVGASWYGYDQAGRLVEIMHDANYQTRSYSLSYDVKGRLVGRGGWDGGGFGYDAGDRLISATGASVESYHYDANGNRINDGYSTGGDNRLTSDGVYSYNYDNEGNRSGRTSLVDGSWEWYGYDYRGRLVSAGSYDDQGHQFRSLTYTYDGQDRRIGKVVGWEEEGEEGMVWRERSEWVALEGDKLLLAVDREESGEQRERYLWGVEGLLAEESGRFNQSSQPTQVTIWLAADQQGTVRDWYNDAGNYLDHYTYDSFGKVVWQQMSGNTLHPRFGYADSEGEENGLYHMGRRMYDPQSGRFLQPDPLGFADDANQFSYAHNSPLMWRDPSGLSAVNVVRGVGAGLSAAPILGSALGGMAAGLGAAMTAGRTLYGAAGVSSPWF